MKGNKDTGGQATDSKRRQKVMSFIQSLLCCFHDGLSFSEQHKFPTRILKFSALLPRQRRCAYASVWKIPRCVWEMGQAAFTAKHSTEPVTASCKELHFQGEGTCRQCWEGRRGRRGYFLATGCQSLLRVEWTNQIPLCSIWIFKGDTPKHVCF